jgi:uncharacterized protein YbjT (DUF2867 family)
MRGAVPAYTIVKPAFFMENFVDPKARWMFPLLSQGELLVACAPGTRVPVIGGEDFGAAVAAIVSTPDRHTGAEIELGSDAVTFSEVAETIGAVTGCSITASHRPAAEVDRRLGRLSWSPTQLWFDRVGYPARPEHAAEHGLDVSTTFRRWAELRREDLLAATRPQQ